MGHLGAGHAGLQKADPVFMGGDVDIPDAARGGVTFLDEHRAFQRGVIARDHREGVQGQDIPALQLARRHRVMRAVGVDARLEPHPGVAIFGVRKALGDFQLHRVATGHGDINLARAFLHRLTDGKAADVGDIRAVADQLDFSGGFVHALLHDGHRDIDALFRLEESVQLFGLHQRQVVGLAADDLVFAGHRQDRAPVIVALPVGIGDAVAMAAPPRLGGVNAGRDGHTFAAGDNQAIGAAERAVKKARVIGDGVHRGENAGVNAMHLHDLAQTLDAGIIFRGGKGQDPVALVETVLLRTFRHNRPHHRGLVSVARDPERSRRTGLWQAGLASSGDVPLGRRHRPGSGSKIAKGAATVYGVLVTRGRG